MAAFPRTKATQKLLKAFGWLVPSPDFRCPAGVILPNRSRATLVQETQYDTTWESQYLVKPTWRNMPKPGECLVPHKESMPRNQLVHWTLLKYSR